MKVLTAQPVRPTRAHIARRQIVALAPATARLHERLAIGYVFVELWITAVGGPYKWGLVLGHIAPLNSLQDVIAFLIVVLAGINWIFGGLAVSARGLLLGGIMLIALLSGMAQNGIVATVIGLKIILPAIIGYMVAPAMADPRRLKMFSTQMFVIYFITAIGIYIDKFIDYPWYGLVYESLGLTRHVSRQWWAGGEERIAGFTLSSQTAALLMMCATWAVLLRTRSAILRMIVIVVAFYMVWITTTKTLIMLLPIFAVVASLPSKSRSMVTALAAKLFLLVSAASLLASALMSDGDLTMREFASTLQWRFQLSWPLAFDGTATYKLPFGSGIGSAGLPNRMYGDPYLGALDNFLLWMMLNFGIIGSALIVWPLFTRRNLPERLVLMEGFGMILLGYGMTVTLMETRFSAIMLGIYLGLLTMAVSGDEERGEPLGRARRAAAAA